jgi:hypothetical protein
MEIVLFFGVLFLFFAEISGLCDKIITCEIEALNDGATCIFSLVTIDRNDNVTIRTNPLDIDVSTIYSVFIEKSSMYSIPPEISIKFPSLQSFYASYNQIQQIEAETFVNAPNLERISLDGVSLTQIHKDSFKGNL